MATDDRKVLNALETLFSDANLQWDKVMQKHLQEQNDYITVDTLLTLPRLKHVSATKDDIINATNESIRLQLNSDKTAVGRIKPFVLNKKEELDDWSIYVEGLEKPYDTNEKITELFRDLVGPVSFLRIPNDAGGKPRFHGYCFIEFDNKENVSKAVNRLNRYQLDMQDDQQEDSTTDHVTQTADALQLRVMSKTQWNQYKDQYLAHQAQCKEDIKQLWDNYNATRAQHGDAQPSKKRRTSENDNHNNTEVTSTEEDDDYPKGIIARVTNIHPASSKTTVKTLLESSGVKIAYLNYKKNTFTCHIRLNSAKDTQKIAMYFEEAMITQKDGKDATGYQTKDENDNKPIVVQPITGMEEKIYWDEERRRDTKKKK
ncbi:hypothetical protein RO3G_06967 [Lichtheimia corymbifera JMRC:FSU:9682]|uniref:La-related protein 7 n=1 Tax=Lichtheimia corymbifera JMRC:FSU:9682 TaxID=1263082 RepID=A0A068RMY8_9FUNG|nr:hypothetical protein RO3G_06967 [Lichtheimia corymbifera JMRC:FSU:9682]